jgi:hypothetical protein
LPIADYFDLGELAREVALQFITEIDSSDIKVLVLQDTEKVFNKAKTTIIPIEEMHQTLLDNKQGEFEVDYLDENISKRILGNILAEFQIKSRPHRYGGGIPQKCWFKRDFEEMWERYADY